MSAPGSYDHLMRSTQTWDTADEVSFVEHMASRGRWAVLRSMLAHVSTRRYDAGVDRHAVRYALERRLEGM